MEEGEGEDVNMISIIVLLLLFVLLFFMFRNPIAEFVMNIYELIFNG